MCGRWTRRAHFRKDLLNKLFRSGLMGIEIPEEFGGQGGSFFQSVLAVEELAAVDPSASVIVDVQNTLVNNALIRWGTEEQKRVICLVSPRVRWALTRCRKRVRVRMRSRSRRGRCRRAAITFLPAASFGSPMRPRRASFPCVRELQIRKPATKESRAFWWSAGSAGFSGGQERRQAGDSSIVDVRVDSGQLPGAGGNVIGEVGKGYKIAIETLNEGRIGIGGQMLGLAHGALDHAMAYARERKQFGKAIADFQGIQFQIAEMAVDVEAARLMVYNAARLRDAGHAVRDGSGDGEVFRVGDRRAVASRAVEIFGGAGFTKDYPVEKLYRDAKIGPDLRRYEQHAAGTIARHFLEKRVRLVSRQLVSIEG